MSLRVTSRRQNQQLAAIGHEEWKGASGAKCQNRNQFATQGQLTKTAERRRCGFPASSQTSLGFAELRLGRRVSTLRRLSRRSPRAKADFPQNPQSSRLTPSEHIINAKSDSERASSRQAPRWKIAHNVDVAKKLNAVPCIVERCRASANDSSTSSVASPIPHDTTSASQAMS